MELLDVLELYQRHAADLRRVRSDQWRLYRKRCIPPHEKSAFTRATRKVLRKAGLAPSGLETMNPQLDDICAEITYLRVRHSRPQTVVEISPCGGWSTCWLLHALRDNGVGRLFSYDLIDLSLRHVPEGLAGERWSFHQGDVTKAVHELPARIDYLFIDSDHTADFAAWYTEALLEKLPAGTPVSVDDVYHSADPGSFGGEGRVVVDWLESREIRFFTPAPARDPNTYASIVDLKESLGLGSRIHKSTANSTIFFSL